MSFSGLEEIEELIRIRPMSFVYAILTWMLIMVVMGFGLLKVMYGASVWFLALPVLAFVFLVGKIGCKTH